MNVAVKELMGEVNKINDMLTNIENIYASREGWLVTGERNLEKAVLMAEIFVNYYTCLETLFFRILQFFENSLPAERWHAELLRKMTLNIPDIREAVIADETFSILDEFRKFRHFKRYYFAMDYDWDRLIFLKKKFERVLIIVPNDLEQFLKFFQLLT